MTTQLVKELAARVKNETNDGITSFDAAFRKVIGQKWSSGNIPQKVGTYRKLFAAVHNQVFHPDKVSEVRKPMQRRRRVSRGWIESDKRRFQSVNED